MIATFPVRSKSFMTSLQRWIVVADHAGSFGFSEEGPGERRLIAL